MLPVARVSFKGAALLSATPTAVGIRGPPDPDPSLPDFRVPANVRHPLAFFWATLRRSAAEPACNSGIPHNVSWPPPPKLANPIAPWWLLFAFDYLQLGVRLLLLTRIRGSPSERQSATETQSSVSPFLLHRTPLLSTSAFARRPKDDKATAAGQQTLSSDHGHLRGGPSLRFVFGGEALLSASGSATCTSN